MGLRLAENVASGTVNDDDPEVARFRAELVEGLSKNQKSLSPKWFYDAEGSRLFEDITRLPEYYPTRQEAVLLRELAPSLAARFGENAVLVEFGSGASEKTRILLDAAKSFAAYVPIDISPEALAEAADRIGSSYPDLEVAPFVGDFLNLEALPELGRGRRIGFFPGSTIGNLDHAEAVQFLSAARERLGPGALFILGVDLVKEAETLVAAYDDAQGVTAAFNLNVLVRANRELGANFDIDGFQHLALWNEAESRMEMHLRSTQDQRVMVGDQTFVFAGGETIHTESSRKFSLETIEALSEASGWRLVSFDRSAEPSVAVAVLSS